VHLWRRWPVTLLPHQLFKNIGNLQVLDKLMFKIMITRPSVVGAVLKHLCHLVTDDWLTEWPFSSKSSAETLREGWPRPTCCVSHFMCHYFIITSRWRVCYQLCYPV
jgi:hypothetical protein